MTEDLLGGGLDIEGWNYLKNERQAKINEITGTRYVFVRKRTLVKYQSQS